MPDDAGWVRKERAHKKVRFWFLLSACMTLMELVLLGVALSPASLNYYAGAVSALNIVFLCGSWTVSFAILFGGKRPFMLGTLAWLASATLLVWLVYQNIHQSLAAQHAAGF